MGYHIRVKIKSAAILYNNQIYSGESHTLIGLKMLKDGVCKRPYPSGKNQGFVTECGMYVTREQALVIAIEAGQVEKDKTGQLFSEDLKI